MASKTEKQPLKDEYGTNPNEFCACTIRDLQELYHQHWRTGMVLDDFLFGVRVLKEMLRRGFSWEEAGRILT